MYSIGQYVVSRMGFRTNVMIPLALCLIASGLSAQEHPADASIIVEKPRLMGTAYFDCGIPLSHLADNLDDNYGIGFGGEVLYRIEKDNPVWVGAGVHTYAFDSYAIRYFQEFDGQIYNYEDRTTSRLFQAHLLARFQPEVRFLFRPYVQGGLGMHWYFTNTKVRDTDVNETVDRINEGTESVLGFAFHAGVQLVPHRLPQVRGDIRIGYFRNASVGYKRYVEGRGDPSGFPIDYFEDVESAVDMIGLHIGIAIALRPNEEY